MMRIKYDKSPYHDFALLVEFSRATVNMCNMLKKTYGWKALVWDQQVKCWRFSDPRIIRQIKNIFPGCEIDQSVYAFFDRKQQEEALEKRKKQEMAVQEQQFEDMKFRADTNFRPKNLKKDLYPYQNVGVEFLASTNGRAILADGMGLGKTAQAIAYAAHGGFSRILVICPASVKYAWENEIKRWTYLTPIVIGSKSKAEDITKAKAHVIIINYDILKKFADTLLQCVPDLIICDESHVLKNRSAKRSQFVKMLAQKSPRMLFLSGTPFLNRPEELFTTLNMLDERAWPDYYSYTRSFCNGRMTKITVNKKVRNIWEAKGATNQEELRKKISRYFIRRLKEDVLKDLPPKIFSTVPVELDPEFRGLYDRAEEEFLEYLREEKGDEAAERASQAVAVVKLSELRQITSMGKVEAAKEIIENIVDSGEKVVVFSCFNEPLNNLHRLFPGSVLLTGATNSVERQAAVDKFQNDPDTKIFFGGLKAAGVGITLTAGTNVLFLDLSFVPADHTQGADRCHRIGTTKTVNVIQLYAKETLDSDMMDVLKGKQDTFNYLFDGKDTRGEQVEMTLLDDIMSIYRDKVKQK